MCANDGMLHLKLISKKEVISDDQSTIDQLKGGHIGNMVDGILYLGIEEALYLMDVRNAECTANGKPVAFNDIASAFWKSGKFTSRYFTYKDWRDRGLVIKSPDSSYAEPGRMQVKEYPVSSLKLPDYKLHGVFFKTDLLTIIDDAEHGRDIYDRLWFGQYGSYKAPERGRLNKLDVYETLFLIDHGMLVLDNITVKELERHAAARRRDFPRLYQVYKDWREKGYVIKTGFKFGTHFRVYFPGARPFKSESTGWIHSKHVIHVFPKESKLLIYEWARAIRVAHSVRKTFILAVPGDPDERDVGFDYILYHRKGGDAESPDSGPPRFAMLSHSEEEYIGGREFAGALRRARESRLDLLLAIMDRETAVTYYRIRQIRLPHSRQEYYEIDWLQP